MFFKLYSNQDPNKVHMLCWLTDPFNPFYSKGSSSFSLRHPLQHCCLPCPGDGGCRLGCRSLACISGDLEAGSGGVGRPPLRRGSSGGSRGCRISTGLLRRPQTRPRHQGCKARLPIPPWPLDSLSDFCNEEGLRINHLLALTLFRRRAGQVPGFFLYLPIFKK